VFFQKIDQYLFNQKLILIFSWRDSPLKYNDNFEREQKLISDKQQRSAFEYSFFSKLKSCSLSKRIIYKQADVLKQAIQ